MQSVEQEKPYNPLDSLNLGISVTQALLTRDAVPLRLAKPFLGAGVYAIYYKGAFPAYSILADANSEAFTRPIYVGKAIPKGGRKGLVTDTPSESSSLYSRLSKHAASITAAENLELDDFYCRYLAVEDIWIPLGESLMINRFKPVWNLKLDGFGNNPPGKGRYMQKRSPWDVVHPGRGWAANLAEHPRSAEAIMKDIEAFLATADADDKFGFFEVGEPE